MQRDVLLVAEMIDAAERACELVAGTDVTELVRLLRGVLDDLERSASS